MAKCKECVHNEVCPVPHLKDTSVCKQFKDRAKYVEVVRCGNCKHFREPFCVRRDDETHRERINMLTVDFCSYGKEKR